jgi:type IV pilus assembly protein PilM
MASADQGIWAVDIGNSALKAMQLHQGDEGLTVISFDYIEHSTILSAEDVTDVQRHEVIAETLSKFVTNNDVTKKDQIAVSIAGQNSFSRFVPLPPVEPKRIPEIVQFEAVQQIPFDINEVQWDWQLMENPDSPNKSVGLFAIKNEVLSEVLDFFAEEGLTVIVVQISPMAIHNYLLYDRGDVGTESGKATVILDMGAENTTLIVSTQTSVWQRTIRIGGNSFTEAIADAFKIKFKKAEKLKRTAAMSKYIRQIFTAMKPIFTDYSGEIQRSLGFYTSNVGGNGFSRIIALGGGMKLKGLSKYLQQSLKIPVLKPDSFESLQLDESVSPAKFHEHVSDFGIVYGLGVQVLDDAKINTNLLPKRIARAMALARKAKMFTVAACVLLVVSFACLGNTLLQKGKSSAAAQSDFQDTKRVITKAQGIVSDVDKFESQGTPLDKIIEKELEVFKYRNTIPDLRQTILRCLPNPQNTPEAERLFNAYGTGDVTVVKSIPRQDRKILFLTKFRIDYAKNVMTAQFKTENISSRSMGRSSRKKTGGDKKMLVNPMMLRGLGGMPGGGRMPMARAKDQNKSAKDVEGGPGFLVTIEGYSPYAKIEELMDPLAVGSNKGDWGIITRFEKLDALFEGCQFELFGKGDITHFKQEIGLVDLMSATTPEGIGFFRQIERVPAKHLNVEARGARGMGALGLGRLGNLDQSGRILLEDVLVDPMTNEEMSRTYDLYTEDDIAMDSKKTEKSIGVIKLDAKGEKTFIDRDKWFRIQAKFKWIKHPGVVKKN